MNEYKNIIDYLQKTVYKKKERAEILQQKIKEEQNKINDLQNKINVKWKK